MGFTLETLIKHAENAFESAEKNISKLSNDILELEGMSGVKTRHLYNNICDLNNANYLEVGTWKGSTFVSANYKNTINSIAIDNWSEFSTTSLSASPTMDSKSTFLSNIEKYDIKCKVIENDSFKITTDDIEENSIDIYLYDGAHDYESHKKAITHYYKFLSKYSIVIIDDWRTDGDWEAVQRATYDGITESGLIVHKRIEKITFQELNGKSEYWNGFGLFVCEKK